MLQPFNLHARIQELIANEATNAAAGKPARIIAKMNKLVDKVTIDNLYAASQAGVQIDLIVRGLCCLRPGVPGVSENIRVRSIVGRFLEHSRIFYFANAPIEHRVYLGSADLMRRNLYNRVEVVFPLLDPRLQGQALDMLATSLADNTQAWELNADGSYTRLAPAPGERALSSQEAFMRASFGTVKFEG